MEIKQTETFKKWLRNLRDKRAQALIVARLVRLREGLSGGVQPVGDGVSELRIHHGKGYRVYYKKHRNCIILILCGGDKSSQNADIKRAKKLTKEVKL